MEARARGRQLNGVALTAAMTETIAAISTEPAANFKIHPVAALFPALGDGEFQELVADIKTNGQHVPIVLTCDGRRLLTG